MLFPRRPENADDVRAFCASFNEGIRVEYKRSLEGGVRHDLPKVVSSLANSLGGVLVLGVATNRGVPQPPIEGFEPPRGEELPLTVENICLRNTNPPVLPRSTVVRSDVPGRVFLVIEVEESWEAPHAIENSTLVYVRTGNAANPYELADVDLILALVKRREEPMRLRGTLLARARERNTGVNYQDIPHIELEIGPMYPRRPLCSTDDIWRFLLESRYRGGHFFRLERMRRVANGAAEVSKFGTIFVREWFDEYDREGNLAGRCLSFASPLHAALKALHLAGRLYTVFGYRGNVCINMSIGSVLGRRMPFLPEVPPFARQPEEYQCFDQDVSSTHTVAAERLLAQTEPILGNLMTQACWSFWQAMDEFPAEQLRQYVGDILGRMGPL